METTISHPHSARYFGVCVSKDGIHVQITVPKNENKITIIFFCLFLFSFPLCLILPLFFFLCSFASWLLIWTRFFAGHVASAFILNAIGDCRHLHYHLPFYTFISVLLFGCQFKLTPMLILLEIIWDLVHGVWIELLCSNFPYYSAFISDVDGIFATSIASII